MLQRTRTDRVKRKKRMSKVTAGSSASSTTAGAKIDDGTEKTWFVGIDEEQQVGSSTDPQQQASEQNKRDEKGAEIRARRHKFTLNQVPYYRFVSRVFVPLYDVLEVVFFLLEAILTPILAIQYMHTPNTGINLYISPVTLVIQYCIGLRITFGFLVRMTDSFHVDPVTWAIAPGMTRTELGKIAVLCVLGAPFYPIMALLLFFGEKQGYFHCGRVVLNSRRRGGDDPSPTYMAPKCSAKCQSSCRYAVDGERQDSPYCEGLRRFALLAKDHSTELVKREVDPHGFLALYTLIRRALDMATNPEVSYCPSHEVFQSHGFLALLNMLCLLAKVSVLYYTEAESYKWPYTPSPQLSGLGGRIGESLVVGYGALAVFFFCGVLLRLHTFFWAPVFKIALFKLAVILVDLSSTWVVYMLLDTKAFVFYEFLVQTWFTWRLLISYWGLGDWITSAAPKGQSKQIGIFIGAYGKLSLFSHIILDSPYQLGPRIRRQALFIGAAFNYLENNWAGKPVKLVKRGITTKTADKASLTDDEEALENILRKKNDSFETRLQGLVAAHLAVCPRWMPKNQQSTAAASTTTVLPFSTSIDTDGNMVVNTFPLGSPEALMDPEEEEDERETTGENSSQRRMAPILRGLHHHRHGPSALPTDFALGLNPYTLDLDTPVTSECRYDYSRISRYRHAEDANAAEFGFVAPLNLDEQRRPVEIIDLSHLELGEDTSSGSMTGEFLHQNTTSYADDDQHLLSSGAKNPIGRGGERDDDDEDTTTEEEVLRAKRIKRALTEISMQETKSRFKAIFRRCLSGIMFKCFPVSAIMTALWCLFSIFELITPVVVTINMCVSGGKGLPGHLNFYAAFLLTLFWGSLIIAGCLAPSVRRFHTVLSLWHHESGGRHTDESALATLTRDSLSSAIDQHIMPRPAAWVRCNIPSHLMPTDLKDHLAGFMRERDLDLGSALPERDLMRRGGVRRKWRRDDQERDSTPTHLPSSSFSAAGRGGIGCEECGSNSRWKDVQGLEPVSALYPRHYRVLAPDSYSRGHRERHELLGHRWHSEENPPSNDRLTGIVTIPTSVYSPEFRREFFEAGWDQSPWSNATVATYCQQIINPHNWLKTKPTRGVDHEAKKRTTGGHGEDEEENEDEDDDDPVNSSPRTLPEPVKGWLPLAPAQVYSFAESMAEVLDATIVDVATAHRRSGSVGSEAPETSGSTTTTTNTSTTTTTGGHEQRQSHISATVSPQMTTFSLLKEPSAASAFPIYGKIFFQEVDPLEETALLFGNPLKIEGGGMLLAYVFRSYGTNPVLNISEVMERFILVQMNKSGDEMMRRAIRDAAGEAFRKIVQAGKSRGPSVYEEEEGRDGEHGGNDEGETSDILRDESTMSL